MKLYQVIVAEWSECAFRYASLRVRFPDSQRYVFSRVTGSRIWYKPAVNLSNFPINLVTVLIVVIKNPFPRC